MRSFVFLNAAKNEGEYLKIKSAGKGRARQIERGKGQTKWLQEKELHTEDNLIQKTDMDSSMSMEM